MYFGRRTRRAESGFTLIELIIALMIFLMMMPPLITAMKLSSDRIVSYLDYRKAFSRTASVTALLKAPVFYCGFGMPVSPAGYKEAFGNQASEPFNWPGPINTARRAGGFANSELRIAYAQPGSTGLAVSFESSGQEGTLSLSARPEDSEIAGGFAGSHSDMRNWVFFGGTMPPLLPLRITSLNGKMLGVRHNFSGRFTIPEGDRCYLFNAMAVYCANGVVYTKDFRAPGYQPRVSGIMDMRFDLDLDNRLITLYILSRGDNVYTGTPGIIGKDSWPPEYLRPWIDSPSKYQLYASKIVWGLPNCIRENFLDGKDVTERY